jgi:hypothetical protein
MDLQLGPTPLAGVFTAAAVRPALVLRKGILSWDWQQKIDLNLDTLLHEV